MLAKQTFWNLPQEKRKKIIDVAIQEFATKGYQKASINTMIANLGIAKGSIYQYFSNKESLFRYIFDYGLQLIKDMVRQAEKDVLPGQDTFTKIQAFFSSAIQFVKNYPLIFRLYLRTIFENDLPLKQELVERIYLSSLGYLVPLLEEGKSRGEIRTDCQPHLVAFMIMALVDRILQSYLCAHPDLLAHPEPAYVSSPLSSTSPYSPGMSPSSPGEPKVSSHGNGNQPTGNPAIPPYPASPALWIRPKDQEQDLVAELIDILKRGLIASPQQSLPPSTQEGRPEADSGNGADRCR
ncbi:MAG: TetR/AcrR family transcriptional regulator [bacterium]|nr:TetR/AcrR family transcriptional regulator [bacterium]